MFARWTDTVTDIVADAELLRRRRYGVIETVDGRLSRIALLPFPKLIAIPDVFLGGLSRHRRRAGDRCWLYYNQPRRFPNYLALRYIVSSRQGTLATFRAALAVLDEIARLKRTDAILCDVALSRVSDRLLARWGWAALAPRLLHRNYIKRFYGVY
ncbi:MAG: hypothetical protein WD176_06060 [Pirellulales bacterium]